MNTSEQSNNSDNLAESIKERIIDALSPFFGDDSVSKTLEMFLRRYLKTAPYDALIQVIDKVTDFAEEFADVATKRNDDNDSDEASSAVDTGRPDTETGGQGAAGGNESIREVDSGEAVPNDVAQESLDTTQGAVGTEQTVTATENGSDGYQAPLAGDDSANGKEPAETV